MGEKKKESDKGVERSTDMNQVRVGGRKNAKTDWCNWVRVKKGCADKHRIKQSLYSYF